MCAAAAAAAAARQLGCASPAIEEKEMDTDLMGASCPDAGIFLSYWSDVLTRSSADLRAPVQEGADIRLYVFHGCTD